MPLTAGKRVQERENKLAGYPLAANAVGFLGSLVMLKAGVAQRAVAQPDATQAATCVVVGIAEEDFKGGAIDGETRVQTKRTTVLLKNSSAGDAITLSQVGQPAYVVDDETVAKTSATNVRPKAGTIVDVESAGVWVRVSPTA